MANTTNPNKTIDFRPSGGATYNAADEQALNIIGQRIAQARNRTGLSLVKFSRLLANYGVSVSSVAINKWELGYTVPSAYQLVAVSKALNMDVDFSVFTNTPLMPELNEEGLKKVAAYKADLIATGKYKPKPTVNNPIRFVDMRVSSLAVSAGTGAFLDEGNFEMVSFPEHTVPQGADFGLYVTGDSMEPVYHDGQIVWVQQCEQIGIGEVGIFIYDGEGYIKMYDEQKPDDDELESYTDSYGVVHMKPVLHSFNKKYAPRVISAHAGFEIVGRVL